ncbi:dipeptidase [Heliophilum fasciatum]|uniref:Dipeptidase n=1 Tax=Heliophilum fasciatum TaxID=35700 RepID=A0A4R2RK63_9FIRM|nr:dipeptidase [Heliophilum fasciatum]MCW2278528.1 membrane dipeptidase [Heliophilum fasciatum]TCP63483.1 dipeptidase [Heliophilum fasciatum]
MAGKSFLAIDGHCDTLLRWHAQGGADPCDLERWQQGDVQVQFMAAYIEEAYKPVDSFARAVQLIDTYHRSLRQLGNAVMPVLWREDLEKVPVNVEAGRSNDEQGGSNDEQGGSNDEQGARGRGLPRPIGTLLTIEGGEALEGSLEQVAFFFRLGVRSIGLTWNQRNALADGSWHSGGLSAFGRQVVTAMNQQGMIIDLAHIAPAGFWDTLALTAKPVIVSHANCRHLCDHRRNLDDRQIRALAAQGGVLGISFYQEFLGKGPADVGTVADHIEHVCHVSGHAGAVGIGSDFDGMDQPAKGLASTAELPRIWEELLRRRFPEAAIQAIAGTNFLRVLKEILPEKGNS